MRKSRLAALAAAVLTAAAPVAAHATNVPVSLTNTAASRTLYVEDMTGNSLSSLDFGSSRSLPFRVRVVDSSATRSPFSVSATMTNLYLDNSGVTDYSNKITSDKVNLASQVNPLNVLNVSAAVQPLLDTTSTVADSTICSVLSLVPVGGACTIQTHNLVGNVQNINVPVNLSVLSNLPLLPQANETGTFDAPDYSAGPAAADPAASGAAPATPRKLVSGSPISTSAVLTPLHDALSTTIGTAVPTATVTAALQAQFPATWALLNSTQINTILTSTVATAQSLIGSQVLSQTGTYMSLPTLNVTVPSGVPAGAYKGTLVVTALQ